MHLLVRDTRSLDETAPAIDLGHASTDLVFLSFSDSDLAAAASAWAAVEGEKPSLRLVNLAQLRHPMSIDLYVERTISGARAVVVRLLGGLDYWRYGAEEFSITCRRHGVALALVPGDARDDTALAEFSTVSAEALVRLDAYLRSGGPQNVAAALRYAAHLGGLGSDVGTPVQDMPGFGEHPLRLPPTDGPPAAIVFYRSQLLAGDIAPIEALGEALAQRGLWARALFVDSLKNPAAAAFVAGRLSAWRPAVVLNATGFSARHGSGASPLDAADAPVLQLVLSGSDRASWAASSRGLSAADLAMQVVLPELDGRLLTTAISFKAEAAPFDTPAFVPRINRPDADGIALAADRAAGWARLAGTPAGARRLAIVLSDYPGAGGQTGHAVGLDSFASLHAMLCDLDDAGYDIGDIIAQTKRPADGVRGSATPVSRAGVARAGVDARISSTAARFAGLPDRSSCPCLTRVSTRFGGASLRERRVMPAAPVCRHRVDGRVKPTAVRPFSRAKTTTTVMIGLDPTIPAVPTHPAAPVLRLVAATAPRSNRADTHVKHGHDHMLAVESTGQSRISSARDADRRTVAAITQLTHALIGPAAVTFAAYPAAFATLPAAVQARLIAAWGPPPPTVALRALILGNITIAVQPDRGSRLDRRTGYHDADLAPCHAYVAFYLWLRGVHAVVHLGTHGTLEWLPGKAAALGADCLPTALSRGTPVIYPFIVNNPGEAAAAKRRLGAVTIGHLTPPLRPAGSHGAAAELDRLIDEYAAADGLDRRRAGILRGEILRRADEAGLLAESGAARDLPDDAALARLDAYLCDVKELQISDGLHVFGRAPSAERRDAMLVALGISCPGVAGATLAERLDASAASERRALLAALDGRFIAPGPAGAPTRGRADVLPTGRNLAGIDPRAVPTASAMVLAEKAAADLLRRHRQDVGDWPRRLVIDLWGSATLRTGGESLALAFVLMGVRPVWDAGSARVGGIDILPIALLDRPRVDVTLRISGLFRDVFEAQMALFDTAVQALAGRDEDPAWNPLAGAVAPVRMFGAAAGAYGAGDAARLADADRDALGAEYLAASATGYGVRTGAGFAERVAAADGYVHPQDHREGDLLDNLDQALHAGGFAAAAAAMGRAPALYHLDTAAPDRPRTRSLHEEIARVVRGRAANPAWIAGMMRHAYRGGAEIARAVDALHGFAALLPTRLDRQFDLLFDATLGDAAVDRFLNDANPQARASMRLRFQDAIARDAWRPRRNAVADILAGAPP